MIENPAAGRLLHAVHFLSIIGLTQLKAQRFVVGQFIALLQTELRKSYIKCFGFRLSDTPAARSVWIGKSRPKD